jgi:large subunit ribosomal protein L23
MSIFDRFKSSKGKTETKAPKASPKKVADDAKKKAFASVPGGDTKEAVKPVKAEKAEKAASAPAPTKEATGEAYRILQRPVVTEKSARVTGQYTFEVPITATKIDVRNAVLHTYGIQPVNVNVVRLRGKVIRYGRTYGRTKNRKKAIVTLPAGKTIDVFSA